MKFLFKLKLFYSILCFCFNCTLFAYSTEIRDVSDEQTYLSMPQDHVLWQPPKQEYIIKRGINITNGSLLGFSDSTIVGRIIRYLSDDQKYGLSHVGMAIVAYPSQILEIIRKASEKGGLSKRDKKYTQAQLKVMYEAYPYLENVVNGKYPEDEVLDLFCLESSGNAKEVLKVLFPRVQISPMNQIVSGYDGNVCVRVLNEAIPMSELEQEIIKNLGISYEKKVFQLLNSTSDGNKKEDNSSWFCSELVAFLYKTCGVIEDKNICSNNVIPKDFSTRSNVDVLRGKATDELWIKIQDLVN
ncbi:MAG: hypothetical protein LBS83_01830 [Holosporales bacterium]|jgi:hypothetical protein|nr:hypothetical protein [Holosporales bacterium]